MMKLVLKIIIPIFHIQISQNPDDYMENDEYEENCEPSPKLLKLVEQEAREIKMHQEEVEMVNLEDEGKKRMLKLKLV